MRQGGLGASCFRFATKPQLGSKRTLAGFLVAVSTLIALRIQVAGIYLHAAVAKWSVKEWSDGTTLYYWFNDPFIGLPGWLRPLMMPVLTSPVVAIFTWCSLILELMLFAALVMPMARSGIDISLHRLKSVDEFEGHEFDYVNTVLACQSL